MHLLATEEYGLRCLLQVAGNRTARPVTIPEIAEAEGLSVEYTGKIMRALREGGLVTSTRGAAGGYRMARPPEEITPWDVIEALGGAFFPEGFCDSHPGQMQDCVHNAGCSIRALWRQVQGAVQGVLSSVSLADLRRDEAVLAVWLNSPGDRPEAPDGSTRS